MIVLCVCVCVFSFYFLCFVCILDGFFSTRVWCCTCICLSCVCVLCVSVRVACLLRRGGACVRACLFCFVLFVFVLFFCLFFPIFVLLFCSRSCPRHRVSQILVLFLCLLLCCRLIRTPFISLDFFEKKRSDSRSRRRKHN